MAVDGRLSQHPYRKTIVNTAIGSVGMLIGPRALKSLNSIEKIQPRIYGNHSAKIISCYSPTNVSEETDLIAFYNVLASFVRSIPKHKVLIIGGDMNAPKGKNLNNKFSLHISSKQKWETSNRFDARK